MANVIDADDVVTVTPNSTIGKTDKFQGWGETTETKGIYVQAFISTTLHGYPPNMQQKSELDALRVFENLKLIFDSKAADRPALTQEQRTVIKSVLGNHAHLTAHL
ncbi:MAG TPA: hypothetical protein PKX38_01410 [Alphaproteobacteria bacterium]|jgi:hypothetical protein|nr:hypothetical protein [Micavibrio sp.]MBK9562755.1 hypothetical protein [Micavibrio sp.]HQX26575.1 hypothetical protein [Alphaproteobacteria bacterium]